MRNAGHCFKGKSINQRYRLLFRILQQGTDWSIVGKNTSAVKQMREELQRRANARGHGNSKFSQAEMN